MNFSALFSGRRKKIVRWVFGALHGILFSGFIFLFIYPNQPANATNYPLYIYFNALLFLFFLFDLPLALTFFFHRIFKGRTKVLPYMGLIISLGLSAVLLFGIFFGSREFVTKQVTLPYPDLPPAFDGFRIVQISDLHAGSMVDPEEFTRKISNGIQPLKPDLVLFTGDMVNNFSWELNPELTGIFREISSGVPAFAILGNHDYGDYTTWERDEEKQANFNSIVQFYSEAGFTLLRNEHTIIGRGKDSLFLAGVENWGHAHFPKYSNLEKALKGIPPGAFILLMTHNPAHWVEKVQGTGKADLTLSGHTHGMQWGIKWAGIPFSIAFLSGKHWGGLYFDGADHLYVNVGLGVVGVPWRIDMPAEITQIQLKRVKID